MSAATTRRRRAGACTIPAPGGAAGHAEPGGAILSYAISPEEVEYSSSADALSIVNLTLSATNRGDERVQLVRIDISIPYGEADDALTEDPALIGAMPVGATPWAILSRGNGGWTAMPLPPATVIEPRQTLAFRFSNVVVNRVAGETAIGIVEDGKLAQGPRVRKTNPGRDKPTIRHFTASPDQVALGGEVLLSWRAENATSAQLDPGAFPLSNPLKGEVSLPDLRLHNIQRSSQCQQQRGMKLSLNYDGSQLRRIS